MLGGTGNTDTPWRRDSVLEFSPVNEISLHVNSIWSGGGSVCVGCISVFGSRRPEVKEQGVNPLEPNVLDVQVK